MFFRVLKKKPQLCNYFIFSWISVSLLCAAAQPETLAVLRVTLIFKAGEEDDYEEEHLFADALAPGGV